MTAGDEALQSYNQAVHLMNKGPFSKDDVAETRGLLEKALAAGQGVFGDGLIRKIEYYRGVLDLTCGNMENGWRLFENRHPGAAYNPLPIPRYDGGDITGRHLTLYGEQGAGDVIQFARYAGPFAAKGGLVTLAVRPELCRLFRGLSPAVRVEPNSALSLYPDLSWLPLMSAPLASGQPVLGMAAPYLNAEPDLAADWGRRLKHAVGDRAGVFTVGVHWVTTSQSSSAAHRSVPLTCFAEIGDLPIDLISLQQVHDVSEEIGRSGVGIRQMLPLDPGGDMFVDAAALIANLDLVISNDTAIAHLAGAMGKPAWVLLPFSACWRWQLDRTDSPWYPSLRLFRQVQPGDWAGVLRTVREALTALLPPAP